MLQSIAAGGLIVKEDEIFVRHQWCVGSKPIFHPERGVIGFRDVNSVQPSAEIDRLEPGTEFEMSDPAHVCQAELILDVHRFETLVLTHQGGNLVLWSADWNDNLAIGIHGTQQRQARDICIVL